MVLIVAVVALALALTLALAVAVVVVVTVLLVEPVLRKLCVVCRLLLEGHKRRCSAAC